MIYLLAFLSVGVDEALWISDAYVRNLVNLRVQYASGNVRTLLHLRDYRPGDTMSTLGQEYRFNIFRGLLGYDSDRWHVSIGDNDVVFGRGLSLFLSTDEEALLESYLRGVDFAYGSVHLYGGYKRRFIYYSGDSVGQYLAGMYVSGEAAGVNLLYYSDTAMRGGFSTSAYLQAGSGAFSLYVEGALRRGYDVRVFSENWGYGLYGSFSLYLSTFSLSLEFKDYRRLFQYFNLPAPANDYGILSSEGRDEMGYSVSIEGNRFRFSLAQDWGGGMLNILTYYGFTYYSTGVFSYKLSIHGLDWLHNLNETVSSLEIKYSPSWGIIFDMEYRERDGESQPYASIAFIVNGWTLSASSRYYASSTNLDYLLSLRYDDMRNFFVEVGYGAFSGDIVCSSGICRYEPAFRGLKLSAGYIFFR